MRINPIWFEHHLVMELNLGGGVLDIKQLEKSRKRLENALAKKKRDELESALSDFEEQLKTEESKQEEQGLVKKAHEELDILSDLESINLAFIQKLI